MKNLLLIISICLVTWLVLLFWDAPAELFFLDKKTRIEAIPTADSYMQVIKTRKYDREGGISYVLNAKTGLYFSTGDRFELQEPELTAQQPPASDNPWRLTAEIARSSQSGEEISLTGDVHAWQNAKKGKNEFFTDDIRFLPSDNIATTDATVKLVHPEGTTTGKGMKADFNREIYQLLANVRGYYHVR